MFDLQKGNSQDKLSTRIECGQAFTFTEGEELYFASIGLRQPKGCRPCRELRRMTLIPVEVANDKAT